MTNHPGTFTAGLIFTAIGVVYLLEALDVWQVNVARTWPVALIAIGAVIILTSWRRSSTRTEPPPPVTEEPSA